jgi:hypothetical protein
VRNTSGAPQQAVPLFEDALAASARDTLTGADFYRVDALHMLGIAAPAGEQLGWNLKALAGGGRIHGRANAWLARVPAQQHRLGLARAWRLPARARSLAEGACGARGQRRRRQIRIARWTGRARLAFARPP